MNELSSQTAAMRIDIARDPVNTARLTLLSHWLSALPVLFTRESRVDQFEKTSGVFYIGVGDQFDDDRRRIHVA
jgi:hypothetical protein